MGPGREKREAYRAKLLGQMGVTLWSARAAGTDPRVSLGEDPAPAAPANPPVNPPVNQEAWSILTREVAACTACPLHRTRTRPVPGVGDTRARWMIVGEAPGYHEDQQGEPFVGRAGQLLNAMLTAVGLGRDRVYITNTLKCRPPENRDPKPEETAACAGFLTRQIDMVEPGLILAVGRIAAQTLLESTMPLGRMRGRVHRYRDVPLVVTYHPAYLLRSPASKREAWKDLQLARTVTEEGAVPG